MVKRFVTLRWFQFSLRSLLILTTLLCAALSVHVARSQARQRYLVRSVTTFNALFDAQRYAEAQRVADRAYQRYPSPLTEQMVEKAALARQIANGSLSGMSDGCLPSFRGDLVAADTPDDAWSLVQTKTDSWDQLAAHRKRALSRPQ